VVDPSGQLYAPIEAAARTHNAIMTPDVGPRKGPTFLPEKVEPAPGQSEAELRLALSDRVRKGELFAFVEVPTDIMTPGGLLPPALRYYSNEPTYMDLNTWLSMSVSEMVRKKRLEGAGLDPEKIAVLTLPVGAQAMGLYTRGEGGQITEAAPVDPIRTFVVPLVLMFIVFMVVMTAAPQLLNSVLEEKMSRISEVLLGSVTPFELMLGKLIGSAGVALLLGLIYVGGGLGVAIYSGYGHVIPLSMYPVLVLFILLAVFFFGSLYIAIGSACSELKDAQSLMMPVMILTLLPVMLWNAVLKEPNGSFAVGLSLFPPATPFIMLLRLALQPSPPMWQVLLGIVLTTGATLGCVVAAGRIFRVGVLLHGQPASFIQMAKWIFASGTPRQTPPAAKP
jgi:ABC-2 type transport system permease protein